MRQGKTLALVPFALGIVLLGVASAGSWSLPDEAQGMRLNPLFLLSRPDVRDDLKLDADQAAGVDREIIEVFRQATSLRGRTDPGVVADRRAVDERAARWISTHLSPDQRNRLNQLELRWEGPAALTYRHAVADALALSEEQRADLSRIVAARNTARRSPNANLVQEELKLTQAAMTLLSEGQKRRWEALLGPPFLLHPIASRAGTESTTKTR